MLNKHFAHHQKIAVYCKFALRKCAVSVSAEAVRQQK